MESLRLEADDQRKYFLYSKDDHNDSDDDVFFGKTCMNEVKKRVFLNGTHQRKFSLKEPTLEKDKNLSNVKIIEVHSEPDMISTRCKEFISDKTVKGRQNSNPNISQSQSCLSWDLKPDDSFLELEKMVSNLYVSPEKGELDDIPLHPISTNSANSQTNSKSPIKLEPLKCNFFPEITNVNNINCEVVTKNEQKGVIDEGICKLEIKDLTHLNNTHGSEQINTPIFKTPSSTIRGKKYLETKSKSLKKPFHKLSSYEHVISPVASYIKKSQVPLLKDVCPKKPLPGASHIPKPVKSNTELKGSNKENVLLTPIAYRSAKNTKVINVPDKEKMPKCQLAKQIATTLPKPFVIKHDHRERNIMTKLNPSSQDSFADLSLHQADLSVCTQTSAFKKL